MAPVKEVRWKQKSKFWISRELWALIRQRDKALMKCKKSKDSHDHLEFKGFKKFAPKKNQSVKKTVKNQIEENPSYLPKL